MNYADAKKRILQMLVDAGQEIVVILDTYPHHSLSLPMDWLREYECLIDNRFTALEIKKEWLPDLSITNDGISFTLLNVEKEFFCIVPWDAVRQYETLDCFVIWKTPELPEDFSVSEKKKSVPYLRIVK